MGTLASSLNRQLSFKQVLPALGVTLHTYALPAVTTCPICKADGDLRVYQDKLYGGEWASCRSCKFTGDMIALAAATWKLEIKDTLFQLAQKDHIPVAVAAKPVVDRHVEKYVGYHKRMQTFWEASQERMCSSRDPHLLVIKRKLHIVPEATPSSVTWQSRMGQFVGAAEKLDIHECFEQGRVAYYEKTDGRNHKHMNSQVLKGAGWKSVIVIPFHDLPGRLCGFCFVGREVDPVKDWVYRSISHKPEAGLAMLPAIMRGKHPQFGDTKFIFTSLPTAIRLQAKHMDDSSIPLPIASTWHDADRATKNVWDWLEEKDLIFWGWDMLKTIYQARKASGKVALLQVSEESEKRDLRDRPPVYWLHQMQASAYSWQQALEAYLQGISEADYEDTLTRLEMTRSEIKEFIVNCHDDMRERLELLLLQRSTARRINYDGTILIEKNDGWFLETGDRISSAVIRIEKVINTRNGTYYQGIVRFQHHEYRFAELAATLDKGALEWARDFIRDDVKAGMVEYHNMWNKRAVQVAIAFHMPEYGAGVAFTGWDESNAQFNFPQFSISFGGVIEEHDDVLFDAFQSPASALQPPTVFPTEHVDLLSNMSVETQICWAVTACVATNIVAQAVNRNQIPIILDGQGAADAGTVAAIKLGCLELSKLGDVPRDTIREKQGDHKWPLLINCEPTAADSWLHDTAKQGYILKPNWILARVLAARGHFNVVSQPITHGGLQLLQKAPEFVLPHYLKDLCDRRLQLPTESRSFTFNVLADLANWFGTLGGDAATVIKAATILHTPESKTARDWFIETIFRLYEEGGLTFAKAESAAAKTAGTNASIIQVDCVDNPFVWVSRDRLNEAIRAICPIPLDLSLVAESLKIASVLVDYPFKSREGWLLKKDWWETKLDEWRQHESGKST